MKVRADKYLWAIRIFKTRSLAAECITKGKVKLNGEKIKTSRSVSLNDEFDIKTKDKRLVIKVTGLIDKRVSYPLAIENYIDITPEEERQIIKRIASSFYTGKRRSKVGRPTKKERRDLDDFFG